MKTPTACVGSHVYSDTSVIGITSVFQDGHLVQQKFCKQSVLLFGFVSSQVISPTKLQSNTAVLAQFYLYSQIGV